MSTTQIVVAGAPWQVHEDEAEGLVDRLLAAADEGRAVAVRVLDGDGEAVVVLGPGSWPVVVTGVQQQAPLEGFPQH